MICRSCGAVVSRCGFCLRTDRYFKEIVCRSGKVHFCCLSCSLIDVRRQPKDQVLLGGGVHE